MASDLTTRRGEDNQLRQDTARADNIHSVRPHMSASARFLSFLVYYKGVGMATSKHGGSVRNSEA